MIWLAVAFAAAALLLALVAVLAIGDLRNHVDDKLEELEAEFRADVGATFREHGDVAGRTASAVQTLGEELVNIAKVVDAIRQVPAVSCPHGLPHSVPCAECAEGLLADHAARN